MSDSGFERRYDVAGYDAIDTGVLATIPYEFPGRPVEVVLKQPEFTSVCPWSGLPDFAELTIEYVPDQVLIEMKSLKYYLNSYRNVGIAQEHAVRRILDDLAGLCRPRRMQVVGRFTPRGGIDTVVTARYEAPPGA